MRLREERWQVQRRWGWDSEMEGVEVLDRIDDMAESSKSRPLFSHGGDCSARALIQHGEVMRSKMAAKVHRFGLAQTSNLQRSY